ncbi:hypothetical protein Tco_1093638 [Tanacetum coccineum]|uniref:Uncharacterized protein n=1 Tax=Tanacetum coccineum TaxID=301880 RepID=A0ABQ5IDA5_9ASTR
MISRNQRFNGQIHTPHDHVPTDEQAFKGRREAQERKIALSISKHKAASYPELALKTISPSCGLKVNSNNLLNIQTKPQPSAQTEQDIVFTRQQHVDTETPGDQGNVWETYSS